MEFSIPPTWCKFSSEAQYEDGVAGNSSWADGDWNCDGEFDTSDLVAAFQTGGYSVGAVRAANASSVGHDRYFASLGRRE